MNICFVPSGMDIEGMSNPKESKCPIRIVEIEKIVNSFILPFFLKVEAQGLKNSIENGDMQGAAISSYVKQYLGVKQT